MPQVDLETLISACAGGNSDRKITCETLADDDPPENNVILDEYDAPEIPPDFPPESFWLSKDAEYDWFDRNLFLERKESTKGGNSNPANSNNSHIINPNSNSNSNSQRFSINLKSKASIIGLPKTQKTTFVDSKRRTCKPPNIRLFPKRSESVGKSTGAEPGSPKVSCMGRVRSKRGRRRRSNSIKRNDNITVEKASSTVGEKKKKTGFCSRVFGMFRSKKDRKKTFRSGSRKVMEVVMEEEAVVEPLRKSVSVKVREIPVGGESVAEPPGLGGMTRFASGRRSGSWAAEDFSQPGLDRRVGRS